MSKLFLDSFLALCLGHGHRRYFLLKSPLVYIPSLRLVIEVVPEIYEPLAIESQYKSLFLTVVPISRRQLASITGRTTVIAAVKQILSSRKGRFNIRANTIAIQRMAKARSKFHALNKDFIRLETAQLPADLLRANPIYNGEPVEMCSLLTGGRFYLFHPIPSQKEQIN